MKLIKLTQNKILKLYNGKIKKYNIFIYVFKLCRKIFQKKNKQKKSTDKNLSKNVSKIKIKLRKNQQKLKNTRLI